MSKINVSIIVPVYNVSAYIEKCLNSLINQSLKDIEIIVVDDCGIDDSMAKVEMISKQDNRIKIIKNPTNIGLSESRNNGLKIAKGKYIAFLDSDDFVDEHYYENLYIKAEKYSAEIAYSNVAIYNDCDDISYDNWFSDRLFNDKPDVIQTPNEKESIIYSCCCWNKIYKRDFIERYNFQFPKRLYIEDIPYTFFSVMLANKLVGVADSTIFYRQHQNSIMSTAKKDRKSFDIFSIFKYIDDKFYEYGKYTKDIYEYQKILEILKIQNIAGWYYRCPQQYKGEYYSIMSNVFRFINLENNEYATEWEKLRCKKFSENFISEKQCNILKYIQLYYIKKENFKKVFNVLWIQIFKKYNDTKLFELSILYFPFIYLLHYNDIHFLKLIGIPIFTKTKEQNKKSLKIFGLPIYKKCKHTIKKKKTVELKQKLFSILGIITLVKVIKDE